MATPNTLLLRLEGPLQAWGSNEAKFSIRRSSEVPTKSGVLGLLCAAMGIGRKEAGNQWLPVLCTLKMAVRVDRPGYVCWDYHTVGAKQKIRLASLKNVEPNPEKGYMIDPETLSYKNFEYDDRGLLTRREYLADASFLVALQNDDSALISRLDTSLLQPVWPLYLGRKCCPPGLPVRECEPGYYPSLESALRSRPSVRRGEAEPAPEAVDIVLDWIPVFDGESAPSDVEIQYDLPVSFDPPRHLPRFVQRKTLSLHELERDNSSPVVKPWRPPRPRADYKNSDYKKARAERLVMDSGLCMVCKSPATTVQHVDYRRAGGHEEPEDLRALCRLCHDACTMLEYGAGMGMDRIDPCDPAWRDRILAKRAEIVNFRSLGQRSRKLKPEEENG